jgi:hypothetical protein
MKGKSMSKKIMLLALAVVSAAVFALPATASALIPLHLNGDVSGVQTIDDTGPFNPTLSLHDGTTIECNEFHGTTEFESGGTTGTLNLTFGPSCHVVGLGVSCTSAGEATGNIKTLALPFHLVTLPNEEDPGVLVTPNAAAGTFATFTCFGIQTIVSGNGVIGEIEFPDCGDTSDEADILFDITAHGTQKYTTVAGTSTVYDLKKGTTTAAQKATGTITFANEVELECT